MIRPLSVHLLRGVQADSLLEDPAFRAEWLGLCQRCPWATAYQQPDYAAVWYAVYRRRFEPILVLSRDGDGALQGLLALTLSARDGGLIVAGGRQAEYQTWISPPDLGGAFAAQAVRALRRSFPRAVLTFQYLPPGAPTDWLDAADMRRMYRLASHRRPLVRLQRGEEIESVLKNKRTRYRLKQLEKAGPLEFKHITDASEFAELFDTIIHYYDFRQEAMYGLSPFRHDDLKKEYTLARMSSGTARPHATVLTVGDQIASAHLGACTDKEVHLGILAHNPFLAKHSPGKFHLLFLARMLREQGYERLDLTPGDSSYKENFANDCDEVQTLTLFLSPAQRTKAVVRERVVGAVAGGLRTCRVEPGRVRALVHHLTGAHPVHTPSRVLRRARQWLGRQQELRIYSLETARVPDVHEATQVRRDAVGDLLDYQAAEPRPSRQRFLSAALARLENGLHVYTFAENGRLQHFGWLVEAAEQFVLDEEMQDFRFPAHSAYLFDFHTAPEARGRGLFGQSLRAMLRDAAHLPETEKIYISVPADNGPARHVIEKAGFRHESSLFEEVQFGRARRWACVS